MSELAFVTGAASGIGRALVVALARKGFLVVAADRDLAGAEAAVAGLAGARAVALDVSDREAFAREIGALERIDLLFNNAGVGLAGELRDQTVEDWRRVVDVNLWGVVHGIHAAYPRMLAQGRGHIVNTASGAGLVPRPGMAPYAATKAAVVALSTSLRAEAAVHGVKVSVACPGYIATNIMASTAYVGVDREKLTANIPVAPISAEDCAKQILAGVERNRAIIVISKLLALEWWLYRMSPALGVRLANIRGRRFAESRATTR